ncbi:restriction endonuclease subunit S [Streptomyces atratus]
MSQGKPVALQQVCELTAGPSGSLLGGMHDGPDGVPVISPSDLLDNLMVATRGVRRIPLSTVEKLARFELRLGDIVMVRQGPIGRMGLIGPEHAGWFYGSSCVRLRPRQARVLPEYLASYLSYPPVQQMLRGQVQASTISMVNTAALRELTVVVPSLDKQRDVVEVLADIDEQIRVQQEMTARLVALRPAVFGELVEGGRTWGS